MERTANAGELRCLLSLATRLRELAPSTLSKGDRALYCWAEALEKHSSWLADTRPGQSDVSSKLRTYRPVNIIIWQSLSLRLGMSQSQ